MFSIGASVGFPRGNVLKKRRAACGVRLATCGAVGRSRARPRRVGAPCSGARARYKARRPPVAHSAEPSVRTHVHVTRPPHSADMSAIHHILVCALLVSAAVLGKHKKPKPKKFVSPTTKGIQCYNCLSFDHPGCWDPDHPDFANITVPNIDCYIPGMGFLCIVITSESAKLVETGQEIGPVRARTCVPAKDFSKKTVSYSMCSKLSKELSASEIFSRIAVSRPQCTLCKKHLCTDASHC